MNDILPDNGSGPVRIRKMVQEDLDQVVSIEEATFSLPWTKKGFSESLALDYTLYLVAERGGEILGYCGLHQSFEEADITNVAVARSHRGQGVGRSLLQELMRRGAARGIARYTLEVRVSNAAAIHLYQTLGFHEVGIRRGFYTLPVEDALIMWTEPLQGSSME